MKAKAYFEIFDRLIEKGMTPRKVPKKPVILTGGCELYYFPARYLQRYR